MVSQTSFAEFPANLDLIAGDGRVLISLDLQTNILAWLTPVAVILIMVLGGMAMANRSSWGWAIGAVSGIAIAFGAPQIVTWVRGMFGV